MTYAERFASAYPKAIDFPQDEYEGNREAIDAAAAALGYRLAGVRLGFAVFSSKLMQTKGVEFA